MMEKATSVYFFMKRIIILAVYFSNWMDKWEWTFVWIFRYYNIYIVHVFVFCMCINFNLVEILLTFFSIFFLLLLGCKKNLCMPFVCGFTVVHLKNWLKWNDWEMLALSLAFIQSVSQSFSQQQKMCVIIMPKMI